MADLSVKEDHLLEVRLLTAATLFIWPRVDHQQGDRVRFHGNQGSTSTHHPPPRVLSNNYCSGVWERTIAAQVSICMCVCVCVCVYNVSKYEWHCVHILVSYSWSNTALCVCVCEWWLHMFACVNAYDYESKQKRWRSHYWRSSMS